MTEQRPCGTSRYRTWLYGSHQHHHELFWSDDGHPSNIRGEGRRFPVGRTRAGKMAGTVRSVRACRNHWVGRTALARTLRPARSSPVASSA